jgi:hypothetical protein
MSGLPELDTVLHGLNEGDNVVWRLDSVDHYASFAEAFARQSQDKETKAIYFRFGNHPPIIENCSWVETHSLSVEAGFESLVNNVHEVILASGKGRTYIFDLLSSLSDACYSDRMIGNFFKLTAALITEKKGTAYYALKRYFHSYHAMDNILQSAQILIDIYSYNEKIYIKPFKVEGRFGSAMFRLHEWSESKFKPVDESAHVAEVILATPLPGLPSASYRMIGVWDNLFVSAEEALEDQEKDQYSDEKARTVLHRILRLIISKDERFFDLAAKYFSISDILEIWKRMIGTGMIGGKAIGMLLARAILRQHSPKWSNLLEEHDSFFIGSDVFYTYIVENNCWWAVQQQRRLETFLQGNEELREKMLRGDFPDYLIKRFSDMLDYYGQSPIIVRSSSILEDNFGNAFAGKYESVFLANQGTREERLSQFVDAVRQIYASTVSREALNYRKGRGVLETDEQMALLVQRVSGNCYNDYYLPQLAGVGFSFNPYAWNRDIDPEAGMIRLVFGLGTRAVDRSDDDYTRVVALNAPDKRPEANFDEVKRYAQRRADVLNLKSNNFVNIHFTDLLSEAADIPVHLVATKDKDIARACREQGESDRKAWILTFDKLFKNTDFVKDMREMFNIVKTAYNSHVDIEFTTNFLQNGEYKINVVQCRPLQVQVSGMKIIPIPEIDEENFILKAHGAVIGHSRLIRIDRLIYVQPFKYGKLPEQERYALARLIGKITNIEESKRKNIMIIGPGRWGTSTPSLGIPVSFSEIQNVSILCEIDAMHEGLIPDLSLGTHFFNEMVEMNMLYLAYFVDQKNNLLNEPFFAGHENHLLDLLPEEGKWVDTVTVVDAKNQSLRRNIFLNANSVEQTAAVYLE